MMGRLGRGEAAAYPEAALGRTESHFGTITNGDTRRQEGGGGGCVFEGVRGWSLPPGPGLTDEQGGRVRRGVPLWMTASAAPGELPLHRRGESLTLEPPSTSPGRTCAPSMSIRSTRAPTAASCHQRQRLSDARAGGDGRRGVRLRHPLDSSSSITADGTAWTEQVSVTIHLAVMSPEEIRVLTPDGGSGRPDLQHLYTPGGCPGSWPRNPGCAY